VLIDLNDKVVKNPGVVEAFEGRASSLLSSLKHQQCSNTESAITTTLAEIPDSGEQNPITAMSTLSLQSDASDGPTLLAQCSKKLELLLSKLNKKQEGNAVKVALKTFS